MLRTKQSVRVTMSTSPVEEVKDVAQLLAAFNAAALLRANLIRTPRAQGVLLDIQDVIGVLTRAYPITIISASCLIRH